ncbi:hypothetical protein [Myxosarcina sp. GI1]|uniref:hypothetical protein n=1 Tax=Myxosarcina sp. GI1 TaxID=1541065 RepID=UPI0006920796|nr:hypothetical protein [Myxosarcina sp. GI1]
MFTFLKSNLRRLAIASLVAIALFSSLVFSSGNYNTAFAAEPLKRDAVDMAGEDTINDAEYESAKAKRRAMQAQMSQQAEEDDSSKSASEKLNLGEPVPESTKEFFDRDK